MNTSNHSQFYDLSDTYRWILYIRPDIDVSEYRLVRNTGLDSFILVQDITKKPDTVEAPSWFSKAPILVDTKEKLGYFGDLCLEKLVSIDLPPEHVQRLQKYTKRKNKMATEEP
jgi:hypothetical protein